MLQIDDEVEWLIQNMDFVIDPNVAMSMYFKHRNVLLFMVMLNVFFEMLFAIYMYRNLEMMLISLNYVYRGVGHEKLYEVFTRSAQF